MIESRQDLAFRLEAAQNLSRVGSAIQYLDGDLSLELTIRALCQENCAHPAVAKLANDDIRSHALSSARRSLLPEGAGRVLGAIFEAVGMFFEKCLRFGQKRFSLFEQICIFAAACLDQSNPGR